MTKGYTVTSYGYSKKAQKFMDYCDEKAESWGMNMRVPGFISIPIAMGYMVAGFVASEVCDSTATKVVRIVEYR